MSFVDFDISSELKVDTITKDNVYEVKAYFCRGHYEDKLNEITHITESKITNVTESVYVRDERFMDGVTIIYVPTETTRKELLKELYELLIEYKLSTDEVIPECIF
ncbi:MAG: hypothetical protein ABIJ40_09545 [Bacteroidota bacterium]